MCQAGYLDQSTRSFVCPILPPSDEQRAALTAWLSYRVLESEPELTLDLYHTEVPNALRGRGIGRALVLQALPALAQLGPRRVILSCTYLQHLDRQGHLASVRADLPYRIERPVHP